ncbi:hypothetical protein IG631_04463 [Alternaria alternata]|nr:hypothetical protein IG631_04463 [Alternaria alternata]
MNPSNFRIDSREPTSFEHDTTLGHRCGSNEHCNEPKSPSMKHMAGHLDYQLHESQQKLWYHPTSTTSCHPGPSASPKVEAGLTQAYGGFVVVPNHADDMWTCPNCGAENPSWQTFCPLC